MKNKKIKSTNIIKKISHQIGKSNLPFYLRLRQFVLLSFILIGGIVKTSAQNSLNITSSGNTGPTSGTGWSISAGVLTVTGIASIHPSVITNYLNSTGSLTISVNSDGTNSNHVTISNSISYTGSNARTLTIKTPNDITVNAGVAITSSTAALNLVLWSATSNTSGDIFFETNSSTFTTIATKGGHLWMGGGSGSSNWNGLTIGDGYSLGGTLRFVGGNNSHYNGLTLQTNSISTGGGHIQIKCKGKAGDITTGFAGGLYIYGSGSMDSGGGNIEIDAIAQSGSGQKYGVYNFGPYTFLTGNGNLTISGDASQSSSASGSNLTGRGILLWVNNAISTTGNITLIGKKSTASDTYGIHLYSPLSTTNGDITLDGTIILNTAITLGSSNLILSASSTISGASSTNKITTNGTGKVKRSIANGASFTFPVGNSTYNPVTITNNTGATDEFSVNVLDEVYRSYDPTTGAATGVAVTGPRVKRTWNIGKLSGNSNAGNGVNFNFNWSSGEVTTSPAIVSRALYYHSSAGTWTKQTTGITSSTSTSLTYENYKGSFSPFAIGDATTSLPVTWQSFSAEKFTEKVTLKWATGSEQNTKDFVVMHSTDAANWNVLGYINAAGNSNTTRIYTFDHVNPLKNNIFNYYRIKQQDLDGQYSYSKIVSIVYDQTASDCMAYPNPAINKLTIYVSNNQEVRLINQAGATVWKESLTAGRHEVNISHLPKGIYLVQTLCFTNKILIQ